jgi:acetyltransferase-like isoleucine patch superfamily enzyme
MFLTSLIKRIRYQLTYGKLPKYLYQIGRGSILQPSGIRLSFRTRREQRLYVQIGEKCIINADFIFETENGKVEIGDNVHIGSATFISRSGISIGSNVTIAWGVTLYDHNSHSVEWKHRKNDNEQCYIDHIELGNNIMRKDWSNVVSKPIKIEDKVWIGFDVTILKGVTIGEGAVIGAKSVVVSDIPAWSVAAGNPAKVVKKLVQ